MTGFVQIIEFRTTRIDEIRALAAEMPSDGRNAVVRATVTADRDRPGYYLNIVEFGSYDEAMANSARPEVNTFATRMAALCDEPPRFYNLDLLETYDADATSASTKAAVAGAATAVVGAAAAGVAKARQRVQERKKPLVRRPHPPTTLTGAPPPPVVSDPPTASGRAGDTSPGAAPPPAL